MESAIRKQIGWPQLAGLLAATLCIFGAVILLISLRLRGEIRQQIIGRDGEVLTAVASMLHTPAFEDPLWEEGEEPGDLLGTILQTSRLRGVLGVQIFDETGDYWGSVPYGLDEEELSPEQWRGLLQLQPKSEYLPAVNLADRFGFPLAEEAVRPVLMVGVPIYVRGDGGVDGVALYIMDGQELADEFAALDQNLLLQAGAAFGIGAALFSALAVFGFRRLRRTEEVLVERSARLLHANQELVLLAKTSAVGALTAHLIHGLKNPLAGLDEHLNSLATGATAEENWQEAAAAARRMRELIDDVVGILRDDGQRAIYNLSLDEVGELVNLRVGPVAKAAGVVFSSHISGSIQMPGKEANIVVLILVNLLQNGLDASKAGQEVTAKSFRRGDRLSFEVTDQGPGLPPENLDRLFVPGPTTRRGGTGLGLAISHLLARHIGANLSLKKSDATGTVFSLEVPAPKDAAASGTALRTGSAE